MALLSDRHRRRIQKKHKLVIFRKCDGCGDPLEHSYIFGGKGGNGEYCSIKCREEGDEVLKSKEKEERKLLKKKLRKDKKMPKVKEKKSGSSSSSGEPSKSKSGSGSGSASSESASTSSSGSKSTEKRKGKKMAKEKNGKKKSSSKKEDKSKKSSKKSEKKPEKKTGKKKYGNYRAGSTIAILFERLSTGKSQDFKTLFKGVKGATAKPMNRLERHGKKSGQWSLTVDKDNSTAKMKMAGKK